MLSLAFSKSWFVIWLLSNLTQFSLFPHMQPISSHSKRWLLSRESILHPSVLQILSPGDFSKVQLTLNVWGWFQNPCKN